MRIRAFCMVAFSFALVAPVWAQGTLFVEGNNVGIGNPTPAFSLDIQGPNSRLELVDTSAGVAARTLFRLSNNGFARFVLEDRANTSTWLMASASGGSFIFSKVGSGVNEFVVSGGGNLVIGGEMTATAYNTSSSRALKDRITLVDGRDVLTRLVELPVAEWSFRDSSATRHIGPMAEDFRSTFGLGSDDRHIGLMDAAGVALAAIQGLHDLVEEKDARIEDLERRNTELAASNEAIERRLEALEEALAEGRAAKR